MIIVREHGHISPHVIHNHREPLEHRVYGLTREMSEVIILSPVSRQQPSLDLTVPNMSILKPLPNPTSQILCLDLIEYRLTESAKQVVDRLVVVVMHIPRSRSKKVNRMNICCVHCNIPKDLTLATEKSRHLPLPHLIVLSSEVRRTRSSFLVCHLS
jgi:hypothetical protein